jgi:hypothetical protein
MTVRFLDGSYGSKGGALLQSVSPNLRPAFGSAGLTSVLSPKSLILVCMLSTAYMAHFNAPKVCVSLCVPVFVFCTNTSGMDCCLWCLAC